jgi:hypothetical protein
LLSDGHFGHLRFKIFLIFDFDGHLVDRHELWIDGEFLGTLYLALVDVFVNLECDDLICSSMYFALD